MFNSIKEKTISRLFYVLIGAGVLMALANIFHNRSLWFDEALLSLNIVGKSYSGLLKPLDDNQVAPIGFLCVEKFISNLFGNSDWSLRIFPFFSFLLSIPLLYFLAIRLSDSKQVALLSCVFFVFNYFIVYYSGEVKQYSSDVFVVLLLLYMGIKYSSLNDLKSIFWYSFIGSFAIFISNVSIIILFSNATLLMYNNYSKNKKIISSSILPVLFWLFTFCSYYFLFIQHHPSKRSMLRYWQAKDAFMPTNPFKVDFILFFLSKLKMIFTDLVFINEAGWFFIPVFILGIIKLLKNKKAILMISLPVIIHFLLSALKLYPFHSRLILYLVPLLLIVVSIGLFQFHSNVKKKFLKLSLVILFTPLIISLLSMAKKIPIEKEEVKKCMSYINQDRTTIDCIYIYCSSAPAFKFYKSSYSKLSNIDSCIFGDWHRDNWSLHANEVLSLKGNSWLVFSEVYRVDGKNEEEYIIDLLRSSGYRILQQKKYFGATCYQVYKH